MIGVKADMYEKPYIIGHFCAGNAARGKDFSQIDEHMNIEDEHYIMTKVGFYIILKKSALSF